MLKTIMRTPSCKASNLTVTISDANTRLPGSNSGWCVVFFARSLGKQTKTRKSQTILWSSMNSNQRIFSHCTFKTKISTKTNRLPKKLYSSRNFSQKTQGKTATSRSTLVISFWRLLTYKIMSTTLLWSMYLPSWNPLSTQESLIYPLLRTIS